MDNGYSDTGVHRNPLTILMVDDNPADIFFMRTALEHEGIESEILIAGDGEKAIEFIEAAEADPAAPCPQLVLLDLNLPRVGGTEVLRRLRQSIRCAKVQVIIVTSSDAPNDRAETASLGASRYFLKPQDLDGYLKLGAAVREVL
jgi:CheY-like chemotaxis protein